MEEQDCNDQLFNLRVGSAPQAMLVNHTESGQGNRSPVLIH